MGSDSGHDGSRGGRGGDPRQQDGWNDPDNPAFGGSGSSEPSGQTGGGGSNFDRLTKGAKSETLSISIPDKGPKAASSRGFFSSLGSLLGLLNTDATDQVMGINGKTLGQVRSEREAEAKAKDEPFSLPGMSPSSTAPTQVSWGKPGVPSGSGLANADPKSLNQTNTKPGGPRTTDTRTTPNTTGDLSGAFGDGNRDASVVRKQSFVPNAVPRKTVVPKKPVNSTTSNGAPNDDLFELYRRMLGGFFRGSRV